MEYKDYYKSLGVARDASQDEIKKAFRKKARQYHPDVNAGEETERRFKEVNEAYEVLKDPEKRAEYDDIGRNGPQQQGGFRPPPNRDDGFHFSNAGPGSEEAFSDFFENIFGQRQRAQGPAYNARAADQHARVQIGIDDSFGGATRTLSLRMPHIGASGEVQMQDRNIAVKIPRGILEGQTIRLRGQGMEAPGGGQAGDLFLEVSFAPHPTYSIDGRDLHLDLPVTPWEAALGAKIALPTPAGRVNLSIPKNARSGQKLRLKGKGLPAHPAGDIYATLKIVNPKVTSGEAKAFFEKMAREMPFDPRAHLKG